MENEYKPPRKKPTGIIFLLACVGLFVLNGAANLLMANKTSGLGWLLAGVGLVLIVLAGFWGVKRI